MAPFMYQTFIKPILFRFEAERVHDFFTTLGEQLGRFRLTRRVLDWLYNYHGPDISKIVDGLNYRTPFVLAAGFDYNGRLSGILPSLGFGGEEVGSVTFRPSAGNPPPRLRRLLAQRSNGQGNKVFNPL